ncbi:CHAT domain-containing protein [Xylaria sp. FL0064]|nr:CHAT domain-containing protein [Xylaria sp. FL0064]
MILAQTRRAESTLEEINRQTSCLNNQAIKLAENYQQTGRLENLNEAIQIMEQLFVLSNLGAMLGRRFERTGSIDDVNLAVDIASLVVNTTPKSHPDRASRRFERTGSIDDLNLAVDVAEQAVDTIPEDYLNRAVYLSNLGKWLGTRFDHTGSIDDLTRAVDSAGQAVDAAPTNHPDRAGYLTILGNLLGRRFDRTGSIDDLNCAIDIAGQAVDLGRRFDRTGLIDDLNRAIDTVGHSVNATPADHPNRASWLNNLGTWLDDLNRAVDAASQAVDATPTDHPGRATYLSNLGSWLDRALDVVIQAVDATPENHPNRAFDRTGLVDYLNYAVVAAGQAATYLNNLGNWLGTRFRRTGSIDDLNRAIIIASQAVDTTPADHPDRAGRLNNLGNWLGTRFDRTRSIDDLNRAVDVTEQAINTTPTDHPDRAIYLSNLGNWLGTRFDHTESIDDLTRAIDSAGQAVDTTPTDHPNQAINLGNWLGSRFDCTGSMDDLNRQFSSYEEGWHCASRSDWEGSSHLLQQAIETLPDISPRWLKDTDKQHMLVDFAGLASAATATALNAGKDAHNALQLLELGRGVITSLLIETRGNISNLKQKHPRLAKEFISLRDEIDSPGSDLSFSSSTNKVSSWESLSRRRREAVQELDELRLRIRAQPGFKNFHLPPPIDDLKAAAHPDPIIIINLSPYRCDAFVIECHQVRVLGLPNLTLEEVHRYVDELHTSHQPATPPTSLLEWLWDAVAHPVLDALGFQNPVFNTTWPYVWWIPTGLLSQLPLHAAGYHTKSSSETVLDRVMSSYASTVKALIHWRQLHFREPVRPVSNHALLVAMCETPNLPANGSLPFTIDEVEVVKDLCPSLQLQPITPSLRKDDVLKELQACRIFHFAGHGHSHPTEPSRSCLLLEDWMTDPLTVGDRRDHRLQENPPFLAANLADEGINLINAFQLAGFRHVVGTLWEVSDMHCVDVARVLYETLRDEGMTDVAVCRGLHRAVRALRDGGIEAQGTRDAVLISETTEARGATNAYWIPYVHFGV